MAIDTVTDDQIDQLLSVQKEIQNPGAQETNKGSHVQRNFEVESEDGKKFSLYTRQNNRVPDDFSCGLLLYMSNGESLTLVRYNGSSHPHPNKLEGTSTNFKCHIHKATERYIQAQRRPEGYAEATDKYRTLSQALRCIVTDCNVSGLPSELLHRDLFEDESE